MSRYEVCAYTCVFMYFVVSFCIKFALVRHEIFELSYGCNAINTLLQYEGHREPSEANEMEHRLQVKLPVATTLWYLSKEKWKAKNPHGPAHMWPSQSRLARFRHILFALRTRTQCHQHAPTIWRQHWEPDNACEIEHRLKMRLPTTSPDKPGPRTYPNNNVGPPWIPVRLLLMIL